MQTIAIRLKQIKKKFDLSRAELAKILECNESIAANYIYDKTEIPEPKQELLCKRFNINPKWLSTGKGNMILSSPPPGNMHDQIKDLYNQVEKMKDRILKLEGKVG